MTGKALQIFVNVTKIQTRNQPHLYTMTSHNLGTKYSAYVSGNMRLLEMVVLDMKPAKVYTVYTVYSK